MSSEEWDGDLTALGKPSNILYRRLKGQDGGGRGMRRGLDLPESAKSGIIVTITYSVCGLLQRLLGSRLMKALPAQ